MKKPSRKRAQSSSAILTDIKKAVETVGGEGRVKVLLPSGDTMYRVTEVVPTFEADIVLRVESEPCWRKNRERCDSAVSAPVTPSTITSVVSDLNWKPIDTCPATGGLVLVLWRNKSVGTAMLSSTRASSTSRWYSKNKTELTDIPVYWTNLPFFSKAAPDFNT